MILLKDGLMKINAYNKLLNELEEMRQKKFSFDNMNDSEQLFQIWEALKGSDHIGSKISKRWSEIGFQGILILIFNFSMCQKYFYSHSKGHDPSTDFRGMGCLGLANLK